MNNTIFIDVSPRNQCTGCRQSDQPNIAFTFAFQPIVNVLTQTVYAHEALIRGPNGEGAATVLQQVTPENRYRFDQACRVKAIKLAAQLDMKELLSINFLPNAVYEPKACIRTTLAACEESNFSTSQIIFEVTESENVSDRKHLVNVFEAYRAYGFRTAIDDFGAGYAGLSLLTEYQPHTLKLDMDLIRGIDTSKAKQAIVAGVLHTARLLNISVVAEGVETEEERDYLISMGIVLMQGYLFCKPAFESLGEINSDAWKSKIPSEIRMIKTFAACG